MKTHTFHRRRQLRYLLKAALITLVLLFIKGDIGGFGAGSDFAWQPWPVIGVDVGKHATLKIGYRFLSEDYETGSGAQLFKYDVST